MANPIKEATHALPEPLVSGLEPRVIRAINSLLLCFFLLLVILLLLLLPL